jgi:hypothetical protein
MLALSLSLMLDKPLVRAMYLRTNGFFADFEGLTRIDTGRGAWLLALLAAQAVLGWVLSSLSRGAIAHVALCGEGLRQACRMALSRMPALLVSGLVYGIVIGGAGVGVNAWLREADLDISYPGRRFISVQGAQKVMAIRTLNALVPDAGSPAAEFIPFARHKAFGGPRFRYDEERFMMFYMNNTSQVYPPENAHRLSKANAQLLLWACVFVLIAGDVLLRFRAVAAVQAQNRWNMWAGGVHHSAQHFGQVMAHVGLLRLVRFGMLLAGVLLPVGLLQGFADPLPAHLRLPIPVFSLHVIALALMLVNGIAGAFCAVYDAQLFKLLQR